MTQPTFSIPQDIITPIIEAQITAAVAQAMSGRADVLHQAVNMVLTTKVDSEGKPSNYSGTKPWIDWVVGDAVRKAATAAIQQFVGQHAEQIKQALIKELQKKNSPLLKSLIDGMISGAFSSDTLRYALTMTVSERSR